MLMQLISTCNIHILHSFKAYFAYAMEMHHLGSFILVLNVCFFAAVYKILNRFTGFWSAMFVVGCYDFKLGGGALFCDLFKTSKAAQSCFYLFIYNSTYYSYKSDENMCFSVFPTGGVYI